MTALQPTDGAALATAPPRPSFGFGLACFFKGMFFTLITPQVWPLAMVPAAIGVVVTAILGSLSVAFLPAIVGDFIGPTSTTLGGVGSVVLKVLATLVALALALLLAFAVAQPLSGPALEGIVRRQERALGMGPRSDTSFLSDVWCSLQSLLVGLMIGVPPLLLLFALSFIVPFASIVLFPLKLVVAAFTLAWDMCDYPLSVRGLPLAHRMGVVWQHKGAVLGFGLALALAGLVPCLLLLLLPGGVAGAAQLMVAIEHYERAHGRDMDGIPRRPSS